MARDTNKKKITYQWKKFLRTYQYKIKFEDHGIVRSQERFPDYWYKFTAQEKTDLIIQSKVLAYCNFDNQGSFEIINTKYNIKFIIIETTGKVRTVKFLDAELAESEYADPKIIRNIKTTTKGKRNNRPRYKI